MSRQGWTYPASLADLIGVLHAEAYLKVHSKKDSSAIHLPRPWDGAKAEKVTEEDVKIAVERLTRRSAFRDVEADSLTDDAS